MAIKIPEFILAGMFVKGSMRSTDDGFAFALKNTYAPATVHGFGVEVDGRSVPSQNITLRLEGASVTRCADDLGPEEPFALPVDTRLDIHVSDAAAVEDRLRLHVDTREVGLLSFSVKSAAAGTRPVHWPRGLRLRRTLLPALRADVEVDGGTVVGTIRPEVYGHFVEHLERCVYGGVWDANGRLNRDVVDLVRGMAPPLVRYPGGNFASDYHWEDGVGPKAARPAHYDRAWHVEDPNLVGTDEFLAFCREVGAAPLLVVNDGSGTPEEAAHWVEYCNGSADTQMGRRRADNGHPDPYGVRIWGLGNEVWGDWQIGHTDAAGYVRRIKPFIRAMREVDPSIRLVAVGLDHLSGDPRGAADWNGTVLRGLGQDIDYLSFHVYQPSEEGYRASYDPDELYRSIVAAPLSTEDVIRRIGAQVDDLCPDRTVGIALDEWNVKFPPPPSARTMHEQEYTLRDALYVAGMLNVFHRRCESLHLGCFSMLVNVLPAVVKPADASACYTPMAAPFVLYRSMQPLALGCSVQAPEFNSPGLGLNIDERTAVPWLDATATRNDDSSAATIGLVNRHPVRRMSCRVRLRNVAARVPSRARRMSGDVPLSYDVSVKQVSDPAIKGDVLKIELPPASLTVIELVKE